MMMTYVAILFTQWLAAGPLREPGQVQPQAQTPLIWASAELPKLFFSNFLHFGFIIGILCVIGVWILLKNTVLGYEMRAVGKNPYAAEAAGINPKHMIVIALFFSGCLAGLAGSVEILGYYHRFRDAWSSGLGFDGITVAVLGANSPMGSFLAALFFGFLRAGGTTMQTVGRVPAEMISVIQGLVVLFVAAPKIVTWLAKKNVSWAIWIQDKPRKTIPIFLAAIFALIGSLAGLGIGATGVGSMIQNNIIRPEIFLLFWEQLWFKVFFVVSIISIIFGIIGLMVFYGTLVFKKWAIFGLLPISICWIIIGVVNTIFLGGTLLLPMVTLGVVSLVLMVWSYMLVYKQGVTFGGDV